MKCKFCGSNHLRRFEAIHKEGGRIGVSAGPRYNVHYSSTSTLALECAPPLRPETTSIGAIAGLAFLYICGFGGTLFVFAMATKLAGWIAGIAAASITASFAWYVCSRLDRSAIQNIDSRATADQQAYVASMDEWQHSWYCKDCGRSSVYKD